MASKLQREPQVGKVSGNKNTPDNRGQKAQLKAAEALKKNSPLMAIRAKCLDCCCNIEAEVRKCTVKTCPIHPFRMGRKPTSKSPGSIAKVKDTPTS